MPRPPSRDAIPTEQISRAALQVAQAAGVDRPCKHDARLDDHSERLSAIETRINTGDVAFAEIRKDLETLTSKVGALTSVLAWVGGVVGVGLLGTCGTALVWVIGHMGAK